jgi:hypothetical protein
MTDSRSFIVRLDERPNFFTALHEGSVFGTPYPSVASIYEYAVADAISRRLRDRGYTAAVVADLFGEPVSVASLKASAPVSEEKLLEYYDDRPTKADWDLMRETIAHKDPKELAAKLGISVSELQTKMSDAIRRFGGNTVEQEQIDARE